MTTIREVPCQVGIAITLGAGFELIAIGALSASVIVFWMVTL